MAALMGVYRGVRWSAESDGRRMTVTLDGVGPHVSFEGVGPDEVRRAIAQMIDSRGDDLPALTDAERNWFKGSAAAPAEMALAPRASATPVGADAEKGPPIPSPSAAGPAAVSMAAHKRSHKKKRAYPLDTRDR